MAFIEYGGKGSQGLDNILGIHGGQTKVRAAHVRLYRELMFEASPLSRAQREMLAVVVSVANDCHY